MAAETQTVTVQLCLLGFGHVARGFCELVADWEDDIARGFGVRYVVTAIGTRHGSLLEPAGLPAGEVLARTQTGLPSPARPADELIAASGAGVLIESTVMEHAGAPTATGHVEAAFRNGLDVVTVNKGPVAYNYRRLLDLAESLGRRWRFEGTVMDGLPVFNLLEFTLPGARLLGFDAVFNSTTNFIIDAMAEGRSFGEALAQTQADGYAEADPANDIDGWDAASKAAALANVAMDARLTPDEVEKESLRDVPLERILAARREGRRLRMLTSAERAEGGAVVARVRAVELPLDHPLAPVGGPSLGAVLHTDLMGDVVVAELGALVPQTAYAVLSDLLTLHRGL
jgi:homoserine dehydrogenase